MASKFKADKTFTSGDLSVTLGHRNGTRLVKISRGSDAGAIVLDHDEADEIGNLLDDALDFYDEHPEHWS